MKYRGTDPDDATSFRSVAVWWRSLTCVPIGAALGFVCSVVILSTRGVDPLTGPGSWTDTMTVALGAGASLGAVYLPISYLIFLRKERLFAALIGIAIGTIFFGVISLGFLGLAAPAVLTASIGFWLSCIAIYANRARRRSEVGWQGYFSPPMKRK